MADEFCEAEIDAPMIVKSASKFGDDPPSDKHSKKALRFNLGTDGRLAHTAAHSYRLTMATLQPDERRQPNCACSTINKGKRSPHRENQVIVIVEHDLKEHILCILDSKEKQQCTLNLMIQAGEQVAYRVIGKTQVHLTGVYFDAH